MSLLPLAFSPLARLPVFYGPLAADFADASLRSTPNSCPFASRDSSRTTAGPTYADHARRSVVSLHRLDNYRHHATLPVLSLPSVCPASQPAIKPSPQPDATSHPARFFVPPPQFRFSQTARVPSGLAIFTPIQLQQLALRRCSRKRHRHPLCPLLASHQPWPPVHRLISPTPWRRSTAATCTFTRYRYLLLRMTPSDDTSRPSSSRRASSLAPVCTLPVNLW